ncbi:hypothetical protein HDU76_011633, partial [Blyttiomyces sp. JEL0837]
LDLMLLSVLDVYGDVTDFPWYSSVHDTDIEWTLQMLEGLRMIAKNPQTSKFEITADGGFALEMGRREVSAQMSRFLLNVWRSTFADDQVKEDSCIIAALGSYGAGRILRNRFSYHKLLDWDDRFNEAILSSEDGLASTFIRLNVYYRWKEFKKKKQRKKWSKQAGISYADMKEVHVMKKSIHTHLKKRKDLQQKEAWEPDDTDWEQSYFRSGNTLNDSQRKSFLLEQLVASRYTHLALVVNEDVRFLMGDELRIGKVDRNENARYDHPDRMKLVLVNSISVKKLGTLELYYMNHLDPIHDAAIKMVPPTYLAQFFAKVVNNITQDVDTEDLYDHYIYD